MLAASTSSHQAYLALRDNFPGISSCGQQQNEQDILLSTIPESLKHVDPSSRAKLQRAGASSLGTGSARAANLGMSTPTVDSVLVAPAFDAASSAAGSAGVPAACAGWPPNGVGCGLVSPSIKRYTSGRVRLIAMQRFSDHSWVCCHSLPSYMVVIFVIVVPPSCTSNILF